jgi:hypothetical protein
VRTTGVVRALAPLYAAPAVSTLAGLSRTLGRFSPLRRRSATVRRSCRIGCDSAAGGRRLSAWRGQGYTRGDRPQQRAVGLGRPHRRAATHPRRAQAGGDQPRRGRRGRDLADRVGPRRRARGGAACANAAPTRPDPGAGRRPKRPGLRWPRPSAASATSTRSIRRTRRSLAVSATAADFVTRTMRAPELLAFGPLSAREFTRRRCRSTSGRRGASSAGCSIRSASRGSTSRAGATCSRCASRP